MAKAEEYIRGDQYLFKTEVIKVNEIASGKFLLKFNKLFDFKSGHVVAISIDDTHEPRIYSICSGENELEISILFDEKEDGILTPLMARMTKGDHLFVSKPYGSFLPDKNSNMWFIATGTGIAPFHSMIQSGFTPEKLIHGARETNLFYFNKTFRENLGENYIQCNSGITDIEDFQGRVTEYLAKQEMLPTNNKYYLCGRALMVVEVRDILISKGVSYEHIISEIFF